MLWLKAFHIIFVVCWFAGLFYLPRIFVYYAASEHRVVRAQLAVMARKLYRFVTPFMLIAVGLGAAMITRNPDYYLTSPWMQVKLGAVALLVVYHFICGHYVRVLNENRNKRSHVFYRVFNEIPVLFLFGIVIIAVIKPF
jgi:putative membrane protein